MFWKIKLWFRNRRKNYLVFVVLREKQIWNQETREYELSNFKDRSFSVCRKLRPYDVKNGFLRDEAKFIWELLEPEEKGLCWVSITGLIRI